MSATDLYTRFNTDEIVDLTEYKVDHTFQWKRCNTTTLKLGTGSVYRGSEIEVDTVECFAFFVNANDFIKNVKCVNVFAKDTDLTSPSNLTSLECDLIHVKITQYCTVEDAVALVKKWTSTIPSFSGKKIGFNMPAKMIMENNGNCWIDFFDEDIMNVGGLADDDEDIELGPVDL